MGKNKNSRSWKLAEKLIYTAFAILKDNDGELQGKKVIEEVGQRIELDDWAKSRYEKSGYIRWQSVLHFYTIDCIKAGFLIKKKGVWYLTPEGEEAFKLGETGLLETATQAYRKWKAEKDVTESLNGDLDTEENSDKNNEVTISEYEELAVEGLKKYVRNLNAYEFQDLVAALLRGMGYYTTFVAPKGKDGGIDVIAYRDPLGTVSPRIKVQIKHREQAASVDEIRQLRGLLQKDGDVGIFVSTGGFTSDSKRETRSSHTHIELIDLDRFIDLWQEFYEKLTDEDKKVLPLTPIYFLGI
ncbi:MAG: restriction endonuclease [Xenococcaceae cyanobacterium]